MYIEEIIGTNSGNIALFLFVALLLDGLFGEPKWLWSRFVHPAILMGKIIGWAEHKFNSGDKKKIKGSITVFVLCMFMVVIGIIVSKLPDFGIIQTLIAAILLAQKSLTQHVSAVADALRLSTEDARLSVARIVGRDTRDMDQTAISRSAIESAAENLSDGVVAPALWFLLLGLPGLLVYKIINTADSMIGYMSPKYREFGWAAAKLDDLLNWVPARITALLILITHNKLGAWRIVLRDAPLHRSPNAGWPEAALAVSLNIALSGPRSYDGKMCDYPYVNAEACHHLTADNIDLAVRALWRVWIAIVVISVLACLTWW